MSHTELPWRINPKALGLIESESAHRSCASASSYSDGSDEAHEENKANAAFIVKAVNSHEMLVEALKEISDSMAYIINHASLESFYSRAMSDCEKARKALAQAEE